MNSLFDLTLTLAFLSAFPSAGFGDGAPAASPNASSQSIVPQVQPSLETDLPKSKDLLSWHSRQDVTIVPTPADPAVNTPASVTYDVSSLNPHFTITPAEIAKCISDASRDVEKNTGEDKILDPFYRTPSGVRGSHGKAHESGVWLVDMDGAPFLLEGYKAAHLYEKPDIPESWMKVGAYAHAVRFIVSLVDLPKIGTTIFDKDRTANTAAVTVEKFILTDDTDHAIKPFANGGVTNLGLKTDYDTFYSRGNRNRFSYLPYYTNRYIVEFPLFDTATGKALIKTTCKKIRLHIISQSGEQAVDYDLK